MNGFAMLRIPSRASMTSQLRNLVKPTRIDDYEKPSTPARYRHLKQ